MINKINMMHQNKKQIQDLSLSKQIQKRNSYMLAQNEQTIQNLNKKIDRRLNIGYYCEVPAIRRQGNYQHRKIFVAKNTPQKKKYPIVKRKKKEQKVVCNDCQQNTDEIQFADDFQNTSRFYTEKKEEPDTKNTAMQWSYEVEKANQETQHYVESIDGAAQYQFVELQDISIQYEDPEGFTELTELKEMSIQYDLFEQNKQEIVVENKEMQCEKLDKSQKCFQFDEIKPIVMQKKLQIDLPDLRNIQQMEQLEYNLFKAQKQKQRQIKISKAYKSQMEMLKLKQEITKVQSQIEIAQIKSKNNEKQKEIERQLQSQRATFLKQRKRDLTSLNRQFQSKLSGLIHSLKSKEKANNNEIKINSQILIQKEKQDTIIENSVISTREQLQKTKNDLKEEMKKRMRYQSDQENQDRRVTSFSKNNQLQSSSQISRIRMKSLFPNPEKADRLFAGTIIKNISYNLSPKEQNQDNNHYRLAKISRAYCERRLQISGLLTKREKSLKQDASIIENNVASTRQMRNLRSSSISLLKNKNKNVNKYVKVNQAKVLKMQQLRSLQTKINNLHHSQICNKYLYNQQQKMVLGNELYKIFNPHLVVNKKIDIFKFKQYLVYMYAYCQVIYFIVFHHSLNYVLYGQQPNAISNLVQFFSHPTMYKDYWGIEYSSEIIYNGEYQRGQKHGYGLQTQGNNVYEGYFQHDVKLGKGKNIFQNGDHYEGEFKNNYAHGEGIYSWKNGERYEGFFENGKRHGYGRHIYPNGDIFEGFYSHDLKLGRGKYRWNDGKVYEGYYKNDMKCGQGKITNPDESYFIGIWTDDICTYVCRKIGARKTKNMSEANRTLCIF